MRPRLKALWIGGLLLAGSPSAGPARAADPAPATRPDSADEAARLDRGAAVRGVLVAALERAYADGAWPDRLPDGGPDLAYDPPGRVSTEEAGQIVATAVVVLHERPGDPAGGVWVGYADGHLEFAPDAAALADCRSQSDLARRNAAAAERIGHPPARPALGPATGTLDLRLVDPDGRPAAGALVGVFGYSGDDFPDLPRAYFEHQGPGHRSLATDDRGRVTVPADWAFAPPFLFSDGPVAPLYAVHEGRELAALDTFERSAFGDGGPVREVRLRPACRIAGDVTSVGRPPGRRASADLDSIRALIYPVGRPDLISVKSISNGSHLDFLVPPGDYALSVRAGGSASVTRWVRVTPDRRAIDLRLDVPPRPIDTLVGKPAPELRQIKGWSGGEPTTLADLRGRVVLLDFWGTWCGPCLSAMPDLMGLHDEFADRGLTVVAVHDDSVAALDATLAGLPDDPRLGWADRRLPFRVALDGGGETRVAGSAQTARGATTAAYGVDSFPTTILIGRDGRVIGEADVRDPDTRGRIVAALAEPAP